MKVAEAFPSKWISGSDLGEGELRTRITGATLEPVGEKREKKLCLFFATGEKGLICNKTNAKVLSKAYGDDTDGWLDKELILYSKEIEFQGETVDAVRVKVPL